MIHLRGGSAVNKTCDGAPTGVLQADGGLQISRDSGFHRVKTPGMVEELHHFSIFPTNVWRFSASKAQSSAFPHGLRRLGAAFTRPSSNKVTTKRNIKDKQSHV